LNVIDELVDAGPVSVVKWRAEGEVRTLMSVQRFHLTT